MEHEPPLLLTSRIKPDYGFYVQADDRLLCVVYASVSGLVVRFSGYFLAFDGTIKQYAIEIIPTSDRVATTATQFFGEGIILSCSVHLLSGSANRGQCYIRARIQRGTGSMALPLARLLQGYLSDDYAPTFPYGQMESPLAGVGMIRSITGTDPAAGAEISETVPTGARWRLLTMAMTLVADATVATRTVLLQLDDGTSIVWRSAAQADQTAGTTRIYSIGSSGYAGSATANRLTIPMPADVVLAAGFRVKTETSNLQAGDNFGPPQLLVEEWIET